jgi:uncharacterized membrane protein YagU involved in acid resistance
MTISIAAQTRLRPDVDGPIDYDASDHVVVAAAKVLRWDPSTPAGRKLLFNLVHWGYGSLVALEYERFRRVFGSDAKAAVAFYGACQAMALTLFPVLGDTPPPWQWKRGLLVSSFVQHALYVTTVAGVSGAFRRHRHAGSR